MDIWRTVVALGLSVDMALVRLENLSVIIMVNWFSALVFSNGPRLSLAKRSKVLVGGKVLASVVNCYFVCFWRMKRFLWWLHRHHSPCESGKTFASSGLTCAFLSGGRLGESCNRGAKAMGAKQLGHTARRDFNLHHTSGGTSVSVLYLRISGSQGLALVNV